MSNPITGVIAVLGRVLLCAIFIMTVPGQFILKFDETIGYMEGVGMPAPKLMLIGAIAFLTLGCISVVLGLYARVGAALIAVFLVLANFYFHAFWKADPKAQQMMMIDFMKNLSIIGAMLFIVGNGAGKMSLDEKFAGKPSIPTA